jgi:hypothetical protein
LHDQCGHFLFGDGELAFIVRLDGLYFFLEAIESLIRRIDGTGRLWAAQESAAAESLRGDEQDGEDDDSF